MNTISTALSGMNAASLRLDTSANNVANSLTPGYKRQTTEQQATPGGGVATTVTQADAEGESLAEDLVTQIDASYQFKANLKVLQTQDRLLGTLVDLRA
jgi:flagellar hook protein FlgE